MRRRSLAVAVVMTGLTVACGGGGDPGPTSGQQVLAGRDVGELFFWKQRTLAFTRQTQDPSQPEPQDLWIWQLDEPAPEIALPGVDWAFPRSWPRWFVGDLLLTGARLERFYDLAARESATLSQGLDRRPGDGGVPDAGAARISSGTSAPLAAMRSDGGAVAALQSDRTDTIIVGRPDSLQTITVPGGGIIGGMTFVGADIAFLHLRQVGADALVGIDRLDVATGAVTPLVAATPAAEWIGITGFCDVATPGSVCGLFGEAGCAFGEPPCPDGSAPPCLLLYGKVDPNDPAKTAGYVYDVGAGGSMRLAGQNTDRLFSSSVHHQVVWGSTSEGATHHWNVCTAATYTCPFSPGDATTWRGDGGAFAAYAFNGGIGIAAADGSCSAAPTAAAAGVYQVQYSPTNDRLLWVADDTTQGATQILYVASADDPQAPVAIASGPALGARFSGAGDAIYMGTFSESTSALSWFDLRSSPPVEQRLSSNYGQLAQGGDRRVLFTDHWNSQDGSGEAVILDIDTGARQVLARSVTQLAMSGNVDEAGGDVAYAVRGRGASSRDGLWLTTLP